MLSTPFKEGVGFYQSPANQHWEDTGDEAYHSLSLNKKRQECLDIFMMSEQR